MTALYITSLQPGEGKTALAAGIGSQLKKRGKKVGLFKPVSVVAGKETAQAAEPDAVFVKQALSLAEPDAVFVKQALSLAEPAESLCAFRLTVQELGEAISRQGNGFGTTIQKKYDAVSQGKDIVIVEGLSGLEPGSATANATAQIVKQLKAKAILVAGYRLDLSPDKLVAAARSLGQDLLGVVVNAIPQGKMEAVRSKIGAALAEKGIKVLGLLPQERGLVGLSVADMAQHLEGKILNNAEAGGELVENLMVGSLTVDPGLLYLGRKADKAVITHGDRADIQLVALNTSTRCVVLTGNKPPIDRVKAEAAEKKVPLILVQQDTPSTIATIERALQQVRFSQPKKLAKLEALLAQNFDFKALYQGLGI